MRRYADRHGPWNDMLASYASPGRFRVFRYGLIVLAAPLIMARFFQAWLGPAEGLDPSWGWGVNTAAAAGLVFGRDVVFNFGPYGAVAFATYDPGVRGLIIGGGAILGLAFTAGVLTLLARRPALLLSLVAVLPLLIVMGGLTFALPLPALLLCADAKRNAPLRGARLFAVLSVLPALGLLPLVKGSFLTVTLIGVGGLFIVFWQAGQRRLAVAVPAVTALSLAGLWLAAGQPLGALPAYFAGMVEVVRGYSDGMAMAGSKQGIVNAIVCCAVFLAFLAAGARGLPRVSGLTLMAAATGLLWIAFKAGYVRQNAGREADTLATFGLMFIILAGWLKTLPGSFAAAIGLLLLLVPSSPSVWEQPPYRQVFSGAWPSLQVAWRVLEQPTVAARIFSDEVAQVRKLPWHPAGTADIYSFDQAWLFGSGLRWSPRPMFQSYSAYTPGLAEANAAHLTEPGAPDNVFFRVAPIDLRLPALEDGPSWPALLSRYNAVAFDAVTGLAWLRRVAGDPAVPEPGPGLLDAKVGLGRRLPLPATDADLWARIELTPSREGNAMRLLMRAPQPTIHLDFADGHSRTFRLVPGMASAGFLLSPFVASTVDFLRLRHRPGDPPLSRPVAMEVDIDGDAIWAWRHDYRVFLAPIRFPSANGTLQLKNSPLPARVAAPASVAGAACALDGANGDVLPATGLLPVAGLLLVSGWQLFDTGAGVQPDTMSLGFLGSDGSIYAVPAKALSRPDVATAYHIADAGHAGFSAAADLSQLPPGDYAVVGLPRHGDVTRLCRTWLTVRVPVAPVGAK